MKIKPKAVLWGLAIYAGLYVLHLLLLPVLVGTENGGTENSFILYGLHQFLGLVTCLAAGYVAARKAGELGFLHGLAVGISGTFLSLGAALVFALASGQVLPSVQTLPFWLLVNGFLCAFAGLLAVNVQLVEPAPATGSRGRRPPFQA